MKVLVILAILATLFVSIQGHGKLMDPISRGSAWRLKLFKGVFPSVKFDNEWCADGKQVNKRNVTCGVCGPVYNNKPDAQFTTIWKGSLNASVNVTSYERNSFHFKNLPTMLPFIVKTYKKGQQIDVKVKIDANHAGNVTFRICPVVNELVDPKMECFNNNALKFENGMTSLPVNNGTIISGVSGVSGGVHQFKLSLPDKLVCKHCVFQWKWVGNNKQKYYGCSDISIIE